jgi:hypothetical protein
MAKRISFAPSVPISRNKRVVTISLQIGSPEEAMTITLCVPNDAEERDVHALSSARARDFARHFLELPFDFPQRKAYREHRRSALSPEQKALRERLEKGSLEKGKSRATAASLIRQ